MKRLLIAFVVVGLAFSINAARPIDDKNLQPMTSPIQYRTVTIDEPDILKEIYDETDPNIIYVGRAITGANTMAPVWQIFKISKSGSVSKKTWADGDGKFDNIWTDRSTLTYK